MLTTHEARRAMDEAVRGLSAYPGGFEGRGVVIPAGGVRYFPGAWVAVNRLRDLGCDLPIELWHIGPEELTDEMRRLVEPLGVTCVDAVEVRRRRPVRRLRDWELKPFALLNCRFREVLLMDADDVPVVDPTFLFEAAEYREAGAVFWADDPPLPPEDPVWGLAGVEYRDEPSFESCQILVDKGMCWRPLCLAMWMNEHSDFWYEHLYGDKDTFHVAWRKLDVDYAMPPYPLSRIPFTNCHCDFDGSLAFLHRCGDKWRLESPNRYVRGFAGEDACRQHLSVLAERWIGRPNTPYRSDRANNGERALAEHLLARRWAYQGSLRAGTLGFGGDGWVREGRAENEQIWGLNWNGREHVLSLFGDAGLTCHLAAADVRRERWLGRSVLPGRGSVELNAVQ